MPSSGVYLFSEGDKHLYVGRSNNLRLRYRGHCSPSATYKRAAFAFQLARKATGKTKASYKPGTENRSGLMQNAEFETAFTRSKERILAMDYRFVQEPHQLRQALLEIYCAVALNTPYNDVGTH